MNKEQYNKLVPNRSIVSRNGSLYIFKKESNFIVCVAGHVDISKIEFLRFFEYTGMEIPESKFYMYRDTLIFIDYDDVENNCYHGGLIFDMYTEDIIQKCKEDPRTNTKFSFSLEQIQELKDTELMFTIPWDIRYNYCGSAIVIDPDIPEYRFTKNF